MQVLCATDFSEAAARASEVAASLAKALHLPLRLLHCLPDWPYLTDPMLVGDSHLLDSWRQLLDSEAARLRARGIEVVSELRRGKASHEIPAAAADQPTLIVVLGSTGGGRAERWLLGRVAERVAESCPIPVLIIRRPDLLQAWLEDHATLRVLCGVDFTQASDAGLAAVRDLETWGKLEVEAVHLREAPPLPVADAEPRTLSDSDAEIALGRDVWDRANEALGAPPVRVHLPLAKAHPEVALAQLADERDAGLIVLGIHQRHGWDRLGHPSFSRRLLPHAATNVLCVPASTRPVPFRLPKFRRILVATDLDATDQEPLRYALGLLDEGGAIRLLHVIPAPREGLNPLKRSQVFLINSIEADQAQSAAQAELERRIAALPPRPRTQVTAEALIDGDAAQGICAAAERFGADIICLASSGHTRAGSALRGSVAQAVTASSHRPVLTVPPPPP